VSLVQRLLPVDGDRRRIARPYEVTITTVHETSGPRDLAGALARRRRSIRLFNDIGQFSHRLPGPGGTPERAPVDRAHSSHEEGKGGQVLGTTSSSGGWTLSPPAPHVGLDYLRLATSQDCLAIHPRPFARRAT
jgi:hypothetical protein